MVICGRHHSRDIDSYTSVLTFQSATLNCWEWAWGWGYNLKQVERWHPLHRAHCHPLVTYGKVKGNLLTTVVQHVSIHSRYKSFFWIHHTHGTWTSGSIYGRYRYNSLVYHCHIMPLHQRNVVIIRWWGNGHDWTLTVCTYSAVTCNNTHAQAPKLMVFE